jgi:hypothetical protein
MSVREEFPHIGKLVTEGLLSEEAGRIKLTPQGLLVADSIFATFF